MSGPRIPRLPDGWTIWAFSDSHGVTTGLTTALRHAGLIDEAGAWVAPPATALVGCGDYLDRGVDVLGTVRLLRRLETEAAEAGGLALLARGNHEQIVLHLAEGRHELLDTWLHYGGRTTLDAFGWAGPEADVPAMIARLEAAEPGLLDWLHGLPQAVRWRDVLFVHGGLPPWSGPDELGLATEEHLTIRDDFFTTPWSTEAFRAYQRAGIERVVFGHTPGPDGPRIMQDGRLLCLDTNAVGNPRMPADARMLMSLVRLEGAETFAEAPYVLVPTDDAPDRAPA